MHEFIAKHQDKIAGTLSGFDRLVFRGHLRSIGTPQGMMSYLWTNQVFLRTLATLWRRSPSGSRKLPWLQPRLANAR
jgi:hypothetical protein